MEIEPFNFDDSSAMPRVLAQPVHELFTALALRLPGQRALLTATQTVTYRELDQHSDAIAAVLIGRGVRRGDRVGLYAQRSAATIAAIIGILKAGASYLPFDPSYPPNLLRHIHDDGAPALILASASLLQAGRPVWIADGSLLPIESIASRDATGLLLPVVTPEDPAYVMYTSGSTGRPKGVVVPHRGIMRLVIDNPYAHFGEDEVFLQLAPLSFDASTFEIWGALLNGGTLAIVEETRPSLDDIAHAIAHYGATTLWLTAGLFHLMVDHRLDALKPLRQLLAGGDVLSPPHVNRALRALPGCQLINGYGPTENTTFTCCHRIARDHPADAAIPIGTPIAQTSVHILDEQRQPVADGEEGELYAGGAGVALGYVNRPELTAERFIPDPFSNDAPARLYKTGDRVRRRADGAIEFRGRVDRQVKINGKRIELDEVENCLRRGPGIGDAAVVCIEAADKSRRLAAFVAPPAGSTTADITIPGIRDFLRDELPDYMQPATITPLDTLPLSPTGKIDRARLPAPDSAAQAAADPSPAPSDATEAALLRIWHDVLGNPALGRDDDFFAQGGTSLQLLKIHAIVHAGLSPVVPLADLFRITTVRTLAAHLKQLDKQQPPSLPLAPLPAIDRPLSMPEYYHASVGSSRFTLESPREVVIVLRGQGQLPLARWQHALGRAAEANPGARLRLVGKRKAARWRSDGPAPRLRAIGPCTWDAQGDRGSAFISAVPLSLELGPTVELIVAPQAQGRSLVVLRALHAVFDGAGAVHFLRELFRALRDEPLLGSNAAFSDVDLMLGMGTPVVKSPAVRPGWLTGNGQGRETGDTFRRIRLGHCDGSLLAEVAVHMAAFARQRSDQPVLIAVPVDLRRHVPGLRSTGNFASMLRVPVEPGDRAEDFRRRLHERLAHNRDTAWPRGVDHFRALPLTWLDWLLNRNRWNYRRRRALETAVISDLGAVESGALSCEGFVPLDLATLPLAGSAFATLTTLDRRVEMMINLPRVLASGGRMDAFVAHMGSVGRD